MTRPTRKPRAITTFPRDPGQINAQGLTAPQSDQTGLDRVPHLPEKLKWKWRPHNKTQPALGGSRTVPQVPPSPSYLPPPWRIHTAFPALGDTWPPRIPGGRDTGLLWIQPFHSGVGAGGWGAPSRQLPLAWKQKEETCVCPLGRGTLRKKTVPGCGVAVRHRCPHLSACAGEWWTPAQLPVGVSVLSPSSLITQRSLRLWERRMWFYCVSFSLSLFLLFQIDLGQSAAGSFPLFLSFLFCFVSVLTVYNCWRV